MRIIHREIFMLTFAAAIVQVIVVITCGACGGRGTCLTIRSTTFKKDTKYKDHSQLAQYYKGIV